MDQLRDGVTTARYLYENGVISKGTLEEVHRQYNYAELNPSETGNQNVSRHVADLIVASIKSNSDPPQQTQTQYATDQKLNEEISKLRYEKIKEYDRGYSAAIASIKLKVQSPQFIDLKKMEQLAAENAKLRHQIEELKRELSQLQQQTQQDAKAITQHPLELQALREQSEILKAQHKKDIEALEAQLKAQYKTDLEALKAQHKKDIEALEAQYNAKLEQLEAQLKTQYNAKLESLNQQHAAEIQGLGIGQSQIKLANPSSAPQAQINDTSRLNDLKQQIKSIQKQLEQANAENTRIQEQLEQAKAEKAHIQEQLNKANEEKANLGVLLKRTDGEKTQLNILNEKLKSELDAVKLNLAGADDQLRHLTSELDELRDVKGSPIALYASASKPNEDIEEDGLIYVDKPDAQAMVSKQQYDDLGNKYEEAMQQLIQMATENETKQQQLLGEIAKLKQTLDKLKQELEKYKEYDTIPGILAKVTTIKNTTSAINIVVDELLSARKNIRDTTTHEKELEDVRASERITQATLNELQPMRNMISNLADYGIFGEGIQNNKDKRESNIDYVKAEQIIKKAYADADEFDKTKQRETGLIIDNRTKIAKITELNKQIEELKKIIETERQTHNKEIETVTSNVLGRIQEGIRIGLEKEEKTSRPGLAALIEEKHEFENIMNGKLEEENEKNKKLEEKIIVQQDELRHLREAKAVLSTLQDEKQQMEQQLNASIQQQKTAYEARINELERKVEVLTEKMRPLVEENIKLKEENNGLIEQNTKLGTELDLRTAEDDQHGKGLAIKQRPVVRTGLTLDDITKLSRIPSESQPKNIGQVTGGDQSQSQSQAILILVAVVVIIVLLFIAIVLPSEKVKPHIDISNGGVGGNCSSSPAAYYSHAQRNFI